MINQSCKIINEYGNNDVFERSSAEYAEDTTAEDENEFRYKSGKNLAVRTDATGFPCNKKLKKDRIGILNILRSP